VTVPPEAVRSAVDGGIGEAARLLAARRRAVALTGAGLSVRSGIPAFRGAQGLWEKYDPMEYASIDAFRRSPEKVWRMLFEMIGAVRSARPGPGHEALARLERMGILEAVVTQNVDGLHQAAGSARVIEYHGNARELVCLSCGRRAPAEGVGAGTVPRCPCGAVVKPDVVFFGEAIPGGARERAEEEVRRCGVLLVVGTSATVWPACQLPGLAKEGGAFVVEINPEETELTREVTDLHIPADAHAVLPRLVEEVAAL